MCLMIASCLCYGVSKTETGKAVQGTVKATVVELVNPAEVALYRRVTSTVYPNPTLWWELAVLYYNEMIRRLCEEARRILANFDPVTKDWQIAMFDNWYNNLFYRLISIHHEREEDIFFPAFRDKGIDIPTYISDAYTTSMQDSMDTIKHEITVLQQTDTNEETKSIAANKIKELMPALIDTIYTQLEERERVLVPQIGKNFTENDEKILAGLVVSSETKRKSSKKDAKNGKKKKVTPYTSLLKVDGQFILACMYDACTEWMTPDQLVSFLQLLPPQARMSVKNVWHPLYVQKEKGWAHELLLETAPVVNQPKRRLKLF